MRPYRVIWEIDLDAHSPEEAALLALNIQTARDRNLEFTCAFDVWEGDGGIDGIAGIDGLDGLDYAYIDLFELGVIPVRALSTGHLGTEGNLGAGHLALDTEYALPDA